MEHRLKELFLILLRNKNEFVSREDLMDFVWKEVIVGEQSLTKAVSDLRKFFIAHDIENVKIITLRKLGYKLEIREPKAVGLRKQNYYRLALKSLAYIIIGFITIIILIRAAAY